MKTYIKPVVEVKEFNVMNNIANLDSFLNSGDAPTELNSSVITAANITSYSVNS